jgi:glycosyltransferase involved in cell wall biosynthesis
MILNNKPFLFFSRDERTHALFRKSWHLAANHCGNNARVVCRGFGWKNIFISVFRFAVNFQSRRIVFGASEICLYSIFSRSKDIWVFTGLGRLLIEQGVVSNVVGKFLRFIYRGQTLVVLNEEDKIFINRTMGVKPLVIEGEGYVFKSLNTARQLKMGLTFAYVGRLLKSKGVDQLVASFARHSKPDWRLLLIGDSDFSNKDAVSYDFINYFSSISVGEIVASGFVSDVRAHLREVDVLVSLSRREGLPFSILDGIDAGTYILLSPVAGHLAFAGLPGVTFVESSKLDEFFQKNSKDIDFLLEFDRAARLEVCMKRFGQKAIVESIGKILNQRPY